MQAISYCRVSTDRQAKRELSIPAQSRAIKDFASNKGWSIKKEFIDKGESARTANRPELQSLLQFCKQNSEVKVLIVHKYDRLARNVHDFVSIRTILNKEGVNVVSVSEPLEDSPVGSFMENILASMAEFYSENLGEEIKKGHRSKLAKGEWPHRPPLGYKSVRDSGQKVKHEPDIHIAPLIEEAFQLYSTGNYSMKSLAKVMYESGLVTKGGKPYSGGMMQRILKRKFYMGVLETKGKEIKGIHEPLVSEKLFYKVQKVMEKRSNPVREYGVKYFLLRGVLWCNKCDHRLTAEDNPKGSYYRCFTTPGKKKCNEPYTPIQQFDELAGELLGDLQASDKFRKLLLDEIDYITKERERKADKELRRLKKQLETVEERQMLLAEELISEKIPQHTYTTIEDKYSRKREGIKSKIALLEVDCKEPVEFFQKCIDVASLFSELFQTLEKDGRKQLVKTVFNKIIVENRKIVDYELNPPFNFLLPTQLNSGVEKHLTKTAIRYIFEQLIAYTITEEFPLFSNQMDVFSTHIENLNPGKAISV